MQKWQRYNIVIFLTENAHDGFEEIHRRLTEFYSEKEIAELAAIVINMNLWTRLKLAQGAMPVYQSADE